MLPEALPYHLKVRDYFRSHASTWEFFAAARTRDEQLVAYQTDLLKNTYQFSREGEPGLFEKIDRARAALELADLPVRAYQAADQPGNELNARIIYLHQEAHLVLMGPILEKLDEQELLAVILHELAHVRLYILLNGEVEVADRIINSIANHPQSDPVYPETARLFSLYTEIYCDRCAYTVMGDPTPVISMLLKLATGLMTVNVESYIRQAESIFSTDPGTKSGMPTHPETYIRTRALYLYSVQGETAGPAIAGMIEGVPDLSRLDLFVQQELTDLTYDLLQEYLRPEWMRTELITGLWQQYFPREGTVVDGEARAIRQPEQLAAAIEGMHPDIRTYFGYVLLDFALADPSLEDMPAGRALEFAGELRLSEVYETICKKELQLNDKKWQQQKEKLLKAYAGLSKD
jgi:Peptidase family M48